VKTAIALTMAAAAAALLPGSMLELQRGGEPWRIVTCHFTHFTYEQLAWDGLAFVALGIVSARRNRAAFHATLLASIAVIPIAVLLFTPLDTYRGLSGLASAMFALVVLQHRSWVSLVAGALFLAKIAFEMSTGATLFVNDLGPGVVAVPVAHLAGFASAGLAVLAGIKSRPHVCSLPDSFQKESRSPRKSIEAAGSVASLRPRALKRA
jgi:membrane associated rhomboid family serine protease